MATSSPESGADLLEFCLKSWTAFNENDVTQAHAATAGEVADLLTSAKRFQIFDRFVSNVPDHVLGVFLQNEQFRRALINLRHHQDRHEDVCQLIKNGTFQDGSDLLEVWDLAHYAMWQHEYRKPLSALTRFRIRKRNPPPPTICKEGRPSRNLDNKARAVLLEWLKDHSECPYPKLADREKIIKKTGLTHSQIRTWFANARRRKLLGERKPKKRVTAASAQNKAEKDVKRSSSSAKHLGTAETREEIGSHRPAGQFVQTVVPPVNSPRYLQPSPGPITKSERSGLHGLLCMYNRLATQGSTVSNSPYPSDHLHKYPPSPSSGCSPNHSRFTSGHHRSPALQHEITGSLPQTQKLRSGEVRGNQNKGCNFMSPVLMKSSPGVRTSPVCNESRQTWSSVGSPEVLREQESPFVMNPKFSGFLHSMTSPTQSVESTCTTAARKLAVTTETFTGTPSSVLSQYRVTDLRMANTPLDFSTVPQSPILIGLDTPPDRSSALIRDHCLAMWNTSSWFSAHCPQSPQTPELRSMDHVPDFHNPNHTDGLPVLSTTVSGELIVPTSVDTFLLLQPAPSTTSSAAQTCGITDSVFPPYDAVQGGTAEDVDEAAQILLHLATTTKP